MSADTCNEQTPRALAVEVREGQGLQVGDHNKIVYNCPASAAAGPMVAGKVPQAPPAFQPREDMLSVLAKAGPGVSVVRAVTGMRGTGKTQVAAAYARRRIDDGWHLVAWIDAEDQAGVLNGLTAVAARLGIEASQCDAVESVGELVRNRLEADGDRSLLVFDNVTDVAELRPFLPSAGKAQVLITSTASSAACLGLPVQVDVFTEAEALAFFRERTGCDVSDAARELAEELGYLPLALAQAAAVVAAQRLPYSTYLKRLRSISIDRYLIPRQGEPYPRGVAESVVLSVEAVASADATSLCRDLLDTVSLMPPGGVSREFLYAAGAAGVFGRFDGQGPLTEHMIDEALALLADASLLTFGGDGSMVTAHRLVTRVCRERRAREGILLPLGSGICALLSGLAAALGDPRENRSAAREAVRQAIALNVHLTPYLRDRDASLCRELIVRRVWALWCLNELGHLAHVTGGSGDFLVEDGTRLLGEEHSGSLASRNETVAFRQAIPLFERTLADRVRMLGEEHPETLRSRNNLAVAYQEGGRERDGILLLEQTLAEQAQVLGEEHYDTLTSRYNLAYAYVTADRRQEAISLYEEALAGLERVLGNEHPCTEICRKNLAAANPGSGKACWLTDGEGAASGKYAVTISGGQGVQVGDHNTQKNTVN